MIAYQDSTTSAQIASALSYCHQYDDRDYWCGMAMSIKHELGEDGFTLWDSWGKQSNRYKESSAREVWRSVKANGGKTIKSLFSEAIKGGVEK
jgi:putative DNA primase/helicase